MPNKYTRRAIASAAMLLGAALPFQATAQTPPAAATSPVPEVPGYFRTHVGNLEINTISDGAYTFVASKFLTDIQADDLKRELADGFLTDTYPQAINTFLIKTPTKLILVDTGLGELPAKIPAFLSFLGGSGYGHLVANIRAAGYKPEQVDEILLTHLHVDHVGGLIHDGRAVFPNATIRVDRRDTDFWLSPKQRAAHPDLAPLFEAAAMALKPYQATGRLKPFDGAAEIAPGVRAMPAPGHTPGHSAYVFESGGRRFVAWGDVLHVPDVQFAHPQVAMKFDVDQNLAKKTRETVLNEMASDRDMIGGAHLFFPAIGHVRREGDGFRWEPISYPDQ